MSVLVTSPSCDFFHSDDAPLWYAQAIFGIHTQMVFTDSAGSLYPPTVFPGINIVYFLLPIIFRAVAILERQRAGYPLCYSA